MRDAPAPLLHVGYPKAASTWLQWFLFKPEFGFRRVLNHVEIKHGIISPSPFLYFPEFTRERYEQRVRAAGNAVPVVSSEALAGNLFCGGYDAKQNADRLFATFPEGRVLLVTREQSSFIRALYKSYAEWGMPHSLNRLLHPHDPGRFPQFSLDWLDYSLEAEYYIRLFGRERVMIIPYELIAADLPRFLTDLLAFAQAEVDVQTVLEHPRVAQPINESVPLSTLLLQRWYNRLFIGSGANYSGWFQSVHGKGAYVPRRVLEHFPRLPFLERWLENRFRLKVAAATEGRFEAGNRRLQQVCAHDLAALGYKL